MTGSATFAQVLFDRATRDPQGEVMRVIDGERWTASELWGFAESWAVELREYVDRGDVVASAVPASPTAAALTAAISALGAVELPLSDDMERESGLRLAARARVIVTTTSRLADVPLLQELASRRHPVLLTDDGRVPKPTVVPQVNSLLPRRLPRGAPALIMPTSGTTGRSKAALLPVGAPIGQARRVVQAMAYSTDDVLFSFFPWHHINARHATVLPAMLSGARVVFAGRFSASAFLSQVREEGITAFNFMGAVCMMLLAQPPTPYDRSHCLRAAYGGPAPASLVAEFRERYGVVLRQAYACTELGDVATTSVNEVRPGAAGRPVADYDVAVMDEKGSALPDGTTGELVVRPRRRDLTFLKYVDDPAATAHAWHGDWFRTRDRARLCDGWLYVEGRLGDVIRRRGVNVDPGRVEAALSNHPDISLAAAVAVPSELTEDEILAVVVPRRGATPRPAELWDHCREELPVSFVPRYLALAASLPLNGSLKVDRAAIRRRGMPPGAVDYEQHRPATSTTTETRTETP